MSTLDIRTVNLEIVRSGPPQNQLLSPLTRYLALCGNFPTTTLHVPWEHRQFTRKLVELRYEDGARDQRKRQAVIEETAREIADLLGTVPGLASAVQTDGAEALTHLNLVMSPTELALLPFELSSVPPNRAGGASSFLSLQTVSPVVVTRQVRSVSGEWVMWPRKPKVLFIASSPVGTIPLKQHVQALMGALQPWIEPRTPGETGEEFKHRVSKVLTVLEDADIHQVAQAASEQAFTHVHILAHGMEDPNREGHPYGLAMRSRSEGDRVDVVSGQRMATALRRIRRSVDQPAHPTVVTVASCDSGNVGDVVYTGASFAHELHEEGIPFVVASQFPLSKVGSVNMVDILYRRLLWGDDPREVLHVLRRELYALHTSTAHDWASLVTYCALPPDLPSQLSDTAYEQAKAAIDVALSACDRIVKELTEAGDDGREISPATVEERLERLLDRADRAAARMPTTGEYETEGLGMLGSTEKRKAEVRFHFASCLAEHDAEYDASAQLSKCLAGLKASLAHYWDAVVQNMTEKKTPLKLKRSLHWVLTQHISLRAILGEEFERDFWIAAKLSAEIDLRDPNARVWGHGSLVELYALLLAFPDAGGVAGVEDPLSVAKKHGGMIVEIAGAGSFAVHSTRRQMERYVNWWCSDRFNDFLEREGIVRPAWGRDAGFIDAMKALVQVFPR